MEHYSLLYFWIVITLSLAKIISNSHNRRSYIGTVCPYMWYQLNLYQVISAISLKYIKFMLALFLFHYSFTFTIFNNCLHKYLLLSTFNYFIASHVNIVPALDHDCCMLEQISLLHFLLNLRIEIIQIRCSHL